MKGLLNFKPIQEGIIFHATPNEFGQFLLVSRRIIKFPKVIDVLIEDLMNVRLYSNYLKRVIYQTNQLCFEAVRRNGWTLEFVKNQTDKLCLEAVRHVYFTICKISNQ